MKSTAVVNFSTERTRFKAVMPSQAHSQYSEENSEQEVFIDFSPVGVLAVDSFKMRLPLHKVSITDSKLNKVRKSYIECTGEHDGSEVKKMVFRDVNGVSMNCSIYSIEHGDGGQAGEYVFLTVHAKMLGTRYFDGMSMLNAELIYTAIINFDVVKFSYADFLQASITDVDIKQDFLCMTESVKERCYLMAETHVQVSNALGAKAWYKGAGNNKIYTGHSFNSRKTASARKAPYMKIYFKTFDSLRDAAHRLFFSSHGIDVSANLWRQEFTLKNKKHMQLLNIESTVHGVLSANVLTLRDALLSITQTLFKAPMRAPKIKGRHTPREKVDMRFLWLLMQNTAMSSTQIIEAVCFDLDKSNKAKYAAKLTALKSCDALTASKDMQRTMIDSFLGV